MNGMFDSQNKLMLLFVLSALFRICVMMMSVHVHVHVHVKGCS